MLIFDKLKNYLMNYYLYFINFIVLFAKQIQRLKILII